MRSLPPAPLLNSVVRRGKIEPWSRSGGSQRASRSSGSTTMKAAYIDRIVPAENIHFGELPAPAVGPSDVLVKTTAVCVDPVDTLIRSGQLPEDLPFPFIVGRDMAGVVQSVGRDVRRFAPGDRVWCNNQGYHG